MIASARVVEPFHEFFLASAGVAGALIGLLFVAISVAPQRVIGDGADPAQRLRASAALAAFTNALAISLFALIPTVGVGGTTTIVSVVGLMFIAASLLSVVRLRRTTSVAFRDVSFLVGLLAIFVGETVEGVRLSGHDSTDPLETIAILVVVCFLVGVARAWELIGASSNGLAGEIVAAIRRQAHDQPSASVRTDDDVEG
jgi:hypothetical protein